MINPLFRTEVLRHRRERRWGDPLVVGPLPWRRLALLFALLTFIAVVFLAVHQYQRKVTVGGLLAPRNGLIELRAPATARVAAVTVDAGERVVAGQSLLRLEFDAVGDGTEVIAMRTSLQRQQDELQRELAVELRRAGEIAFDVRERIGRLQQRLAHGVVLERQAGELLAIEEQALDAAERLRARGLLAEADVQRRQVEVLQRRGALERVRLEREDDTAALREARRRATLELLQADGTEATLRQRQSDLARQMLAFERDHGQVVTAPVDGVVGSLAPRPGMTVAPGAVLATVVPGQGELVVSLEIPSAAVGFLAPGMPVALRLDAFPHQKFGVLHATLEQLDGNASMAPDGSVARFRAIASLPRQSITAFGDDRHLLAGMSLQADILLERRSLLEWLFEPVLGLRGHW